jgi:hypothetical protein
VGAIVPYVFYQAAKFFGLAVLFMVVGDAVARNGWKRELGPMPALLVGFVLLAAIGFFIHAAWFVYGWISAGCAILTRFGTMKPWFKRQTATVPPAVAPAAPPPPAPAMPTLPPPGEEKADEPAPE